MHSQLQGCIQFSLHSFEVNNRKSPRKKRTFDIRIVFLTFDFMTKMMTAFLMVIQFNFPKFALNELQKNKKDDLKRTCAKKVCNPASFHCHHILVTFFCHQSSIKKKIAESISN